MTSKATDVVNAAKSGSTIDNMVQRYVAATVKADGIDEPTADQLHWADQGIGEQFRIHLMSADHTTVSNAIRQLEKLEADVERAAKDRTAQKGKPMSAASVDADAGGEGEPNSGHYIPGSVMAQQNAEKNILHPVTDEAPQSKVGADGKVHTKAEVEDTESEERLARKQRNIDKADAKEAHGHSHHKPAK